MIKKYTTKLYFLCATITLTASSNIAAKELTIDEARVVAESFFSGKLPAESRAATAPMQYIETGISRNDEPIYYIFNNDISRRFVIVSADDTMRPVLGYSDNDVYDPDHTPETLKWWLGQYRETGIIKSKSHTLAGNDASRNAIEPLVKTTWDQDVPYNIGCPQVSGGTYGRAYTGCVATAMAQIVKYHDWPQGVGYGSNRYLSNGKYDVAFNFSVTRFDWNNMPSKLTSSAPGKPGSSIEQVNAVAELIYGCGVAVDMQYDRGNGSSSYNALVPEGLREYFGYDPMARHVYRDAYTDAEWENLIYNELAEGRPVQYGGYTPDDGGHSFICDGYDGNGLYHINWGWGGMSDGFFALSVLDPNEQGAGSSDGGYNSGQDAVIGIQPPVDGSKRFCSLYCDESVSFDNNHTISLNGWIINESYNEHTYSLGVIVKDQDGKIITTVPGDGDGVTLDGYMRGVGGRLDNASQYRYNYSYTIPEGSFDGLAAGAYRLYPAYRTGDMDWTILPTLKAPHYIDYIAQGTGGIESVETGRMKISTDGTKLTITGAQDGDGIAVYDITGRAIHSTTYHAPAITVELPARGLYIVICGNNRIKCKV